MTTSNGSEQDRRQHPRFTPGGHYRIRSEKTDEETIQAKDQGPGGAFLPVRRALPEGTLLILDVHDPEVVHRGPPVLLVAEVAYYKATPVMGVGIRWKQAFCEEGLDRLARFLETHFNLFMDPGKISAFHREQLDRTVQYDFVLGTVKPLTDETVEKWRSEQKIFDIQYPQTFLAKADHIVTRARGSGLDTAPVEETAPLSERDGADLDQDLDDDWDPPEISFADGGADPRPDASPRSKSSPTAGDTTEIGFDDFTQDASSGEPGEATGGTDWASNMRQRMQVKIPVLLLPMSGDETFGGTVRALSRNGLFVMVYDTRVYRGDRVVVRFPLSLGPISVKLVFVSTVKRVARDRKSGSLGLDLRIDSVDEGTSPGIFKEFIAALRRRLD